jgi:inosine-uridine nucleoside N-ribohydrolase
VRLVIDTDPGMGTPGADPEDGMAVLYALNAPGVTVEAITLVQGNVAVSQSWPNVHRLLELAGRTDVAVHAGAAEPREPPRRPLQATWLRQREAMASGGRAVDTPPDTAAGHLAETVRASPGEITIVAIGPLTNVAAAIDADPSFASALAGVVIMGGAAEVPGNITPAAEFNIWMDPEAAAVVLDSGAPVTMVGLDVCHRTRFDRGDAARLRASGSSLAAFVADASESWIDVREAILDAGDALHLYDTLAMAAAIDPDVVGTRPALVEVETSTGPAQGMTVTHLDDAMRRLLTGREPNAAVATEVDVERFEGLFAERVAQSL